MLESEPCLAGKPSSRPTPEQAAIFVSNFGQGMAWQVGARCGATVPGYGILQGQIIAPAPSEFVTDGDPAGNRQAISYWVFQADDGRRFEVREAALMALESTE